MDDSGSPLVNNNNNLEVIRKKILLRLLARREAERLGILVSSKDVESMIEGFRVRHGLITANEMEKWLLSEGITHEAFIRMMYDLILVGKLTEVYAHNIAEEIANHVKISSIYETVNGNSSKISQWIQINVAIERHEGDALQGARDIFANLCPLMDKWRNEDILERFFFMRKPPDLRLRFLAKDFQRDIRAELRRIMSKLKKNGVIKYFFQSIYEPEVFQFGGPEAMDLVHAYFDSDSMAWIKLDHLAASHRRSVPTQILVIAVMNDLFYRTLLDSSEVWDVWCNLANLISSEQKTSSQVEQIITIDSLFSYVSDAEGQILRDYLSANEELSLGLRQIWNSGKLQCGLRSILPFIAMFHFNRHGLTADRQANLAYEMKHAWNPKRNLKGS
jgi:thiopeptide-type bacteriocin biosynthesis protein